MALRFGDVIVVPFPFTDQMDGGLGRRLRELVDGRTVADLAAQLAYVNPRRN